MRILGTLASLKSCITLTILIVSTALLSAQNDTPCECKQRWTGGATWNQNGTIDDTPNANDGFPNQAIEGGIVRCGTSAETESGITAQGCTYAPGGFMIDLSQITCVNPITKLPAVPQPANPLSGVEIIWFQFDVRPYAGTFQFQVVSNDDLVWALYYYDPPTNDGTGGGSGANCDNGKLELWNCGTDFPNQFNDNSFVFETPDLENTTNFYLAVWRLSGPSAFSVTFKARQGCGEVACSIEENGAPTLTCNGNGTYTIVQPVQGVNGTFNVVDNTGQALSISTNPSPLTFTTVGVVNPVNTGTVTIVYPEGVNYNFTLDGTDACDLTVSGMAPDCCEPPVITCPPAATVACGASTDPLNTGSATYTDGCGLVSLTYTDAFTASNCGYTITRTWTATDSKNASSSCDQLITVLPAPAPAFINPPGNISITCAQAPPIPGVLSYSNGGTGLCQISGTVTSVITGSHTACGGSYTETWTIDDPCPGRPDIVHSRVIMVSSASAPAFTNLPGNTTISCAQAPPLASMLAYTNGGSGGCAISGSIQSVITGSHDACGGSYTETWTLDDPCPGRPNVVYSRTITVSPAPAPQFFNPPGNTTISCALAPPIASVLTYGNAAPGSCAISGSVTSVITGSHNSCGGSYTETWTIDDPCPNRPNIVYSRTITVSPAPAPSFTSLPGNITITCAQAPPTATSLTYNNGVGGPCSISGSVTSVITGTHNSCGGTYTETWTIDDPCPNRPNIVHSRTITVSPAPAPSFTSLPGNITITCAQAPPTATSLSYTNGGTGGCVISGSVTSVITGTHTACGGTYTETWTIDDPCPNRPNIVHSRTITVSPAPAPSFVVMMGNTTISCNEAPPSPSVLSYTNGAGGSCVISGTVTSVITGSHNSCGGTYTETWTIDDPCPNRPNIVQSRTITVSPAPAPAFINPPGNITLSCGQTVPAPSSLSYSNGGTGGCAISGSVMSVLTGNVTACGGTYTETWTIDDPCPNRPNIVHSRTITVGPAPAPVLLNAPGNTTISCGQAPPTPITLNYSNGLGGICLISGTVTSVITGSHTSCGGTYTETWTIDDPCPGRPHIVYSRTITVSPAPAPAFTSLPANMTINCSQAPPAPSMLSYSNGLGGNCSISGTITSVITGSHNFCGGSYTETWTIDDPCPNRPNIVHTRTITVNPAPQPTFVDVPGNITIACGQGIPSPSSLNFTNGASGGCLYSGSVTSVITGSHTACGGTYMETWSVDNPCPGGQKIEYSRTITVSPAPQASFVNLPGDISVSCSEQNSDELVPTPLSYSNGLTGNCGINGSVISTLTLNAQACPTVYTETWKFIDICGREITHSRNVVVTALWQNANIGNANGSAVYSCSGPSPGAFGPFQATSTGYGNSVADIMHFVYTELSGNGQIIAHFANATNLGFGGIMIRETLAPGSKKVNIRTQNNINIEREVRYTTNGVEVTKQWPRYHKWLRLDRTGNIFNAFSSPTGNANDWWFLGSITVEMNACVLIGVYAEGINAITPTTATFNYVKVNTGTPVIPPPFNGLATFNGIPEPVLAEHEIAPFDVNIYPNPASADEVTLDFSSIPEGNVRIQVYSMQGTPVKDIRLDRAAGATLSVDVSDLPGGVYLFNIQTDDNRSVTKKLQKLN